MKKEEKVTDQGLRVKANETENCGRRRGEMRGVRRENEGEKKRNKLTHALIYAKTEVRVTNPLSGLFSGGGRKPENPEV